MSNFEDYSLWLVTLLYLSFEVIFLLETGLAVLISLMLLGFESFGENMNYDEMRLGI